MSEPNSCNNTVSEIATPATTTTVQNRSYDLSKFQLTSILSNNSNRKTVCCLGQFADNLRESEQALVIFEKTAFTSKDLLTSNLISDSINSSSSSISSGSSIQASASDASKNNIQIEDGKIYTGYFSSLTKLKEAFVNDIYGNFECFPNPEINSKSK